MSGLNRREFVVAGAAAACLCVLGVESIEAAPMGGAIDVGTLDDYKSDGVTDKFVKQHKFFVVRSGEQLFATSAVCTHKACVLNVKDNNIKCKCHGSQFSPQGTATAGPAKGSLVRYAVSLDDKKHLIVDKSRKFPEPKWADPASFVKAA
jgi:Rieske Fe-S protein